MYHKDTDVDMPHVHSSLTFTYHVYILMTPVINGHL